MKVIRDKKAERKALSVEENEYGFRCYGGLNGEIYRRGNDSPIWIYDSDKSDKKLFFLRAQSREVLLTIEREKGWPLSHFSMMENRKAVCAIRQQGFFLNKYLLDFSDRLRWTLHLPLFSTYYRGISDSGDKVFVRMSSHDTWQVKFSPAADSLYMVAALALIHRERQ